MIVLNNFNANLCSDVFVAVASLCALKSPFEMTFKWPLAQGVDFYIICI